MASEHLCKLGGVEYLLKLHNKVESTFAECFRKIIRRLVYIRIKRKRFRRLQVFVAKEIGKSDRRSRKHIECLHRIELIELFRLALYRRKTFYQLFLFGNSGVPVGYYGNKRRFVLEFHFCAVFVTEALGKIVKQIADRPILVGKLHIEKKVSAAFQNMMNRKIYATDIMRLIGRNQFVSQVVRRRIRLEIVPVVIIFIVEKRILRNLGLILTEKRAFLHADEKRRIGL